MNQSTSVSGTLTGTQGWNYGGPMLQDGNLNIGYTKYYRWTNSGNLSQAFRRYGLGATPQVLVLSLIIKISAMT